MRIDRENADIYSLGAVLCVIQSDARPMWAPTTQILHAHVYDPLLIPTEVLESTEAAAVNVLRRSMMEEPARSRYQTANEMAEDLSAVKRMAEAMRRKRPMRR